MTNDTSAMKQCKDCREWFPATTEHFYALKHTADGLQIYCKPCNRVRIKRYTAKREQMQSSDTGIESQRLLIRKLLSQGIYACSGSTSQFAHVDVVAWGCIRIEAKYSRLHSDIGKQKPHYFWGLSHRQYTEGWLADFICLMMDNDDDVTFHLFPADHPVFYTPSGNLKRAVVFIPEARQKRSFKRVKLDGYLMRQYQDRWDLIEAKRQELMRIFKDGEWESLYSPAPISEPRKSLIQPTLFE